MSVSETAETVMLADVALPIPMPRALTYLVPEKLAATATPGRRVLCTLGSRRIVGVVVAVREGEKPKGAKPILSVLDGISLPEDLVVFVARGALDASVVVEHDEHSRTREAAMLHESGEPRLGHEVEQR